MSHDLSSAINDLLPALNRYGHYLSDQPETVEDLVQQTVERLLVRHRQTEDIENLKPYAFSILRNLHHDFLRRKQRQKGHDPDAEPVDPSVDAGQRLCVQQVLEGIAALPVQQGEVLSLVKLGHSYAQIAHQLSLPIGTVMSRISRARTALRILIDLPDSMSVMEWLET